MEGTLKHDLTHIQTYYQNFFRTITVIDESEDSIAFELVTVNDPPRTFACTLTSNGFKDSSSSICFESFEGLIGELMGRKEYGLLFSRLVCDKLG